MFFYFGLFTNQIYVASKKTSSNEKKQLNLLKESETQPRELAVTCAKFLSKLERHVSSTATLTNLSTEDKMHLTAAMLAGVGRPPIRSDAATNTKVVSSSEDSTEGKVNLLSLAQPSGTLLVVDSKGTLERHTIKRN